MSLPKKIAATAAPIVGVVLMLGVPASAQNAQPPSETASATAPKSAVMPKMSAVKHEPGNATHAAKAAKTANDLTTGAK
ncbi:MAG: hypothetical protein ACLP19_25025 [Xanthobacteraceae bacterium]